MHKAIGIIVLSLLVAAFIGNLYSPSYVGQVISVDQLDSVLDQKDRVISSYNGNMRNIPTFVKTMFGDELIVLNISFESENRVMYIKTDNGAIEYIEDTSDDFVTLKVWLESSTIDQIMSSNDQIQEFSDALKDGRIRYEAYTVSTKMKTGMTKLSFNVWRMFF